MGNLCFLQLWNALLLYDREQSFFLHRLPLPAQYWSAALATLLLSAVLFALLRMARWIRRRWGRIWAVPVLFPIILLPANVIRNIVSARYPGLRIRLIGALGLHGIMAIFAAGLLLLAILMATMKGRAARVALLIVAQLSPLFAIEIGEAAWRLVKARPRDYADRPLVPKKNATLRNRVVWIIFDELDYRLAFAERPPTVSMPEFDKLHAQSFYATAAFSPARDTQISVPSLITGRQFSWTRGDGPDTLYAGAIRDLKPIDVNSTIFSDVRRMGGNVAVAGWYLPYCRMFNASLAACSWYDNGNILNITGDGVAQNVVNQTRSLFETSLFSPFGQSLTLKHAIRMVADIRRDALRDVENPAFDLVFLHYPVPHAPHPYNRFTGEFTRSNSGFEGYLDSLALADVILGEVRAEMTRENLWEGTTVLVTSDHPYREAMQLDGKADPRVPFLIKFRGQIRPVQYDRPLHTIVTRDFLNTLFSGTIVSADQPAGWFENH